MLEFDINGNKKKDFNECDLSNFICKGLIEFAKEKDKISQISN